MIKRRLYIVFFGLLCIQVMMAQRSKSPSLWDVRVVGKYGATFTSITSDLNVSAASENFYAAGIQFDYFFKERWALGLGAEYSNQEATLILSDYTHSYSGTDSWSGDPTPRDYTFYIETNNTEIKESLVLNTVNIPISILYNHPIGEYVNISGRLGINIVSIPLQSHYQLMESNLTTQLYFPEWDLLLFDIPAHGLYTNRTDWHPQGNLSGKLFPGVFAELGIDFPFLRELRVRTSLYLGYDVNANYFNPEESLIYWRENYNGILSLSEHFSMSKVGVKVAIGLNKNKKKRMSNEDYNCPGCSWIKDEMEKREKKTR